MKRQVCVIPLKEIQEHFNSNSRQDIKIIVPKIMDDILYNFLQTKNLNPEKEEPMKGITWEHSALGNPNKICEAREFILNEEINPYEGQFTLSFANEKACQEAHYHKKHFELYYTESSIKAKYRIIGTETIENIDVPSGGVIIFGPEVIHLVELEGITIILEFPAVEKDKFIEKLFT